VAISTPGLHTVDLDIETAADVTSDWSFAAKARRAAGMGSEPQSDVDRLRDHHEGR
jgi:hypothetical protein